MTRRMQTTSFDIRVRVTGLAVLPEGIQHQRCVACGSPLEVHQPDPDVSHRLLGSCSCEECGIWYSLIVTPDRGGTYLIRLPSVAELTEAITRRDDCLGHPSP